MALNNLSDPSGEYIGQYGYRHTSRGRVPLERQFDDDFPHLNEETIDLKRFLNQITNET